MAFARVSVEAWKATEHKADTIPYGRLAAKHHIYQPEELLFFRGYAGENAHYGFGTHQTNATGYCSQEKKDSGDASSFEIFWEPEKTQSTPSVSDNTHGLIKFNNPEGFSGSLVWNTRYLETGAAGRDWTPDDAVVTGIVRRWDTAAKTLLIYRVEHVRAWLDSHVS